MDCRYYWTKVWGAPDVPAHDALAFKDKGTRNKVLADINPGDIVVFLTSDATEADPLMRGRVAGAVEIADPPEVVMVEDLRDGRSRDADYRKDGRFRWPFGITVSRTWKVIDQEANDALVPDHASKLMQGAATIHEMHPSEVQRFRRLRVAEQTGDGVGDTQPFAVSQSRPWRQKAGSRSGAEVQPGTQLYIAVITDDHGMTFKVGSGKAQERINALNQYRRGSQGEAMWAEYQVYDFNSVVAARDAEDHIVSSAKAKGFGSKDHSEFIVGIQIRQLADLIS